MSLPVTAEPLPTSYSFGKVVGRVIHLIADTAEDTDDKPQARAAAGKVTFAPKEVLRKTTGEDYPAIVLHKAESATLSGSGRILDAEGRQGIWLAVGIYTVTFDVKDAARAIPSFDIEVTADHTDAAPLDLATVVPYVPPTGTVVQTVLIPAGGTTGQVLVRTADGGLEWADQTAEADVDLTGYVTDQELTDAIAAIPDPDLSGYATTTALSDGLATKVNSSTYTAGLSANSTADRARANHTGTQPATTVTGLATVATTGAYADLSGRPTIPAAYTDEQVRDVIGATIVTGAGLSKTVDDAGNIVTIAAIGGGGDGSATLTRRTVTGSYTLAAADAAGTLLHVAAAAPVVPPMVDDFSSATISGVRWPIQVGSPTAVSGRARVVPGAGVPEIQSGPIFDLTDGYPLSVEVPTLPIVGNGTIKTKFVVMASDYSQIVAFSIEGNPRIIYFEATGGAGGGSVSYNATAHRWLRFYLTGGSLLLQASPDGVTWTTIRTMTQQPWMTAGTLRVTLQSVQTGAVEASPGYAEFDNFNTDAAGPAETTVTITLPSDATATIPLDAPIPWRVYGDTAVTFAAGSDATLLSRADAFTAAGQYAEGIVTKVAANTWLLSGDVA